jgi:glycosyltransferase involved in cell wall biosynthesis
MRNHEILPGSAIAYDYGLLCWPGHCAAVVIMRDDRRVSAIIPVHNGETFLEETIRSVLGQTVSAIECIVVDDGSTDRTAEVAGGFGSDVRLIRQSRAGVSAARNAGAAVASGALFAFIDADDRWKPEKTALQLELLRSKNDLAVVYCGLELIDARGNVIGRIPAPSAQDALRNTLLVEPPVLSLAQTALISREAFFGAGQFDQELSTSADSEFACRLAMRYKVAPLPLCLAQYRLHANQMYKDIAALERDARLMFERLFRDDALPPELRRLRRRATANVRYSMSGSYARAGRRGTAVRHLLAACCADPRRTAVLLATRSQRQRSSIAQV